MHAKKKTVQAFHQSPTDSVQTYESTGANKIVFEQYLQAHMLPYLPLILRHFNSLLYFSYLEYQFGDQSPVVQN